METTEKTKTLFFRLRISGLSCENKPSGAWSPKMWSFSTLSQLPTDALVGRCRRSPSLLDVHQVNHNLVRAQIAVQFLSADRARADYHNLGSSNHSLQAGGKQ